MEFIQCVCILKSVRNSYGGAGNLSGPIEAFSIQYRLAKREKNNIGKSMILLSSFNLEAGGRNRKNNLKEIAVVIVLSIHKGSLVLCQEC